MKIERRAPTFSPLVITLETPQDADRMLTLMIFGADAIRVHASDCKDHRGTIEVAETIRRAIGVI